MANNYQQATTWPPLPLTEGHRLILKAGGCDNEAEIRALGLEGAHLAFALERLEDEDLGLDGVEWHEDPDGGTVFVTPEGGNLDRLAGFLQLVLRDMPEAIRHVEIQWAETCSKMRVGEFGGGAAFITRDDVEWLSTGVWLSERRKALSDADKAAAEGACFPGIVATDLAPHVKALMDRIQAGVEAAVPSVDVEGDEGFAEDDDGEQTWNVGFLPEGKGREFVSLTFTVTSEDARDGTGGFGAGLLLDAVREGGEIVGSWAPYNYTDRVWVRPDDEEPLAELRRRLGVEDGGMEELADSFAASIVEALRAEETT